MPATKLRIHRPTSKTRKLTRPRTRASPSPRTIQKGKAINVLTYNISWESMTGRKPNWELCSNNTDPNHPRHNSVCVSNVARVFEDNPADFVLLQEADSHEHLIQQSPRLAGMRFEFHESSRDKMITFWDKKYKHVHIVRGEFEPGRPWMAILYSNGWCVVNVHFGHYSRKDEIAQLNQLIQKIKKEFSHQANQPNHTNQPNLSKMTRLIIGGDFNYDIKLLGQSGMLTLDTSIEFHYHPRNLLTCCINRRVQNDHVIDTGGPLLDIKIPRVAHMASDHKPILATLACSSLAP